MCSLRLGGLLHDRVCAFHLARVVRRQDTGPHGGEGMDSDEGRAPVPDLRDVAEQRHAGRP